MMYPPTRKKKRPSILTCHYCGSRRRALSDGNMPLGWYRVLLAIKGPHGDITTMAIACSVSCKGHLVRKGV